MNLEQSAAIRIAINDTLNQLRPPLMGNGVPEPTRTALQAHLDALLKEELRALSGQAPEGDFTEKSTTYINPRKDPEPPIYENLWHQATRDLNAAMDLVQQNQEFFGAQCGDDKIKVIGEFFVKWAAVMMKPDISVCVDTSDLHAELARIQGAIAELKVAKCGEPTPWYPDDSGDWVEVSDIHTCRPLPLAEDTEIQYMYQGERERRSVNLVDDIAGALNWSEKPNTEYRIVAYKVVKP